MIFYFIERPHGSLAGHASLEVSQVLLRSSAQPVKILGDCFLRKLGHFLGPRSARSSDTFEVLANLARFVTCAATETKHISSPQTYKKIFVTKKWSRANLVELKFCYVMWW